MQKRTQWFCENRFGLFVHWGLYAIPGRGEWSMSHEKTPVKAYEQYFSQFNPSNYVPTEWAKAAKQAGMKYAVLTAKHHDGFCLFDSKLTEYKSTNAPCGRDLVREYVEAFRAEDLKVGLYYSLLDWHHPDYPKFGDKNHPMRENESFKDEEVDFDRYLDYMHGQVEELMSNYGKIDILWLDFSYDNLRGEAWRATKFVEMVRSYQPNILIDNRLETSGEGFGSLVTANPSAFCGDFVSPEQIIPIEGIRNEQGDAIPWELCTTMNNNWGYNPGDTVYKSPSLLIHKLVECVSKGGNMILNVGPDATGRFPQESLSILKEIGTWMDRNSDSIYGCDYPALPKPEWGRYTKKGNVLYAHVFEQPIGPLALTGIDPATVKSITLLRDGSEVRKGDSWVTASYPGVLFVSLGELPYFSYLLVDASDTVIKIVLA
ncbi:MAG: alpha-L-fucosidase [Ruthenibacterium sp.]